MSTLVRYILPAEWIIVFGFLVYGALLLFGYPVLIPAAEGGEVLMALGRTKNYSIILLTSVGFFVLMTLIRGIMRRQLSIRSLLADIQIFLRLLVCLLLAIYLMLCFKWWAHTDGVLYDELYESLDKTFAWLKDGFFFLDSLAAIPHIYYFHLFSGMFLSGYIMCILFEKEQFTRMVTANIAVAILGGLGYMIAPAYGPVFFSVSEDVALRSSQEAMLSVTEAFRTSGGKIFNPAFFEGVLGAMPSLHIAHAIVITVYNWRLNVGNGLIFCLFTLYIATYAVVTRFHYIVDLQAGIVLSLLCIIIVDRMYAMHRVARTRQ